MDTSSRDTGKGDHSDLDIFVSLHKGGLLLKKEFAFREIPIAQGMYIPCIQVLFCYNFLPCINGSYYIEVYL